MAERTGPDFICIGLQKGGSRWLYDQFRCASGVWMPPIKEINYFHNRSFKPGNRNKLQSWRRLFSLSLHPFRDIRFFRSFEKGSESERYSDDWYLSLFQHKGGCISGDVSPGYSALDDSHVSSIAGFLPNAKVLLLIRHPVDRCKSALSMGVRSGKFSEGSIHSVRQVEKIVNREKFARKSFPSKVWQRWVKYFGKERCRYYFLDDIRVQPGQVRAHIAGFVGLKGARFWLPADFNRKSSNKKYSVPTEVEEFLYAHFRSEILRCKEVFGGAALNWKTGL